MGTFGLDDITIKIGRIYRGIIKIKYNPRTFTLKDDYWYINEDILLIEWQD